MRKTLIATAVASILSAGAFVSSASAMTLAAPAGLRPAIDDANAVEQVRHRCYRARGGGLVCPRHRRVVRSYGYPAYGYTYGYPAYGYYGYGYPSVSLGIGYGGWWGGYWGGSRTVVHRHHHHRHVHRHRGRR
jgi:hypothetical protein